MEYIGFGSIPAPKLKNISNPKDLSALSAKILKFIKKLYQDADLVHGDLSEFNILYHNQQPVIIDISQAVSTQHPKAEVFLVRDIKNVYQYFENFDINLPSAEKFYYEIIDI
jgi:RIO kinase 1